MKPSVLLPWPDVRVPQGMTPGIYDGNTPPPGNLDEVEFYVLPYDRGRAPDRLICAMPALRVVQSLSAGVEKLLPLIPDGVRLANARGLHDASVAEHALALILAAQRDMPRWVRQQDAREWTREHTRSLADCRVAIVGYGSIGRAIERFLEAAQAEIVRVARSPREGVHGVRELPGLLSEVDILVLVLPDEPETRGLIGAAELAALPDDALVVNVGRGSTVHTDALLAETASGRLRAALDVLDPEPLPPEHPLWTTQGVLITPHIAGGSSSFYPRAKRLIAEQLRRFVSGQALLNVVR